MRNFTNPHTAENCLTTEQCTFRFSKAHVSTTSRQRQMALVNVCGYMYVQPYATCIYMPPLSVVKTKYSGMIVLCLYYGMICTHSYIIMVC